MSAQLGISIPRRALVPWDTSVVHAATLAFVWLTFATSGLVFSEPCPTDALTIGLIVLLPLVGLVYVSPILAVIGLAWITLGSLALVASMTAMLMRDAVIHTSVSIYLYLAFVTFAGFIAFRPERHLAVIMNGWMAAALLAAVTGIIGYFDLLPGSEIFTKFGRASGTFKDPNVFGPFLVPAILYALHKALGKNLLSLSALLLLSVSGFLALSVLLSFSRGAWLTMAFAGVLYLGLAFLTAGDRRVRRRIVILALSSIIGIAAIVVTALQFEPVADLAAQRASVDQSYDLGPDGRFGGQQKAWNLILAHPIGLGAQQFANLYHHEEPHNVYLNMHLNAGWLGGTLYLILVMTTIAVGFRQAFQRREGHGVLLIALATFTATAAEGVIVDTDHWRHFYALAAIIWGVTAQRSPFQPAFSSSHQLRSSHD